VHHAPMTIAQTASTLIRTPATYADIEALPEEVVGELVEGELLVSPRPAVPHASTASKLGGLINVLFELGMGGPGGWFIVDEPEIHGTFRGHKLVLVPDFAGWRRDSLPADLDVVHMTLWPAFVCEVLSPSTMLRDQKKKLPAYAAMGVEWVWLVDPKAGGVTVYQRNQPDDAQWTLVGVFGPGPAKIPPFDAVELPLDRFWVPGTQAAAAVAAGDLGDD